MPMTPLSVIDILKFFDDFSKISGRKTNKSKYQKCFKSIENERLNN